MKSLFFSIPVLFLFQVIAISAPFDESQQLRRQFEEFRQSSDAGDHLPISNEEDLAAFYLVYGQKSLAAGEVEAALSNFRAGQELEPEDGRFSLGLGMTYVRMADGLLAEMHLREAIRLMPAAAAPRQVLADLYYRAGRLIEAQEVLAELVRLFPNDRAVVRQLGQVEREIGVESDMVSDVNSLFSVKFDEQVHAAIAGQTVEILQAAYAEQGSLLNYYPQQHIQVILYTRDDYDMTTGAPPWSAGRFDGKIRIPIGKRSFDQDDYRYILSHEYNHFLAQQLSRGRAPAWFYEGLAMVAEDRAARRLDHFAAARSKGATLDFALLEKSFERLPQGSVLLAYEQSFSFVNYLGQQFGWHILHDLLVACGSGLPIEKAFASVFNDFGLDYLTLQSEWLAQE